MLRTWKKKLNKGEKVWAAVYPEVSKTISCGDNGGALGVSIGRNCQAAEGKNYKQRAKDP